MIYRKEKLFDRVYFTAAVIQNLQMELKGFEYEVTKIKYLNKVGKINCSKYLTIWDALNSS